MGDRKESEKRADILAAARALFFERGYEGSSVDAIIEGAGASKGTFYYHFDSKESLLNELTKELTEPVYALIAAIAEGDGDGLSKLNRIFEASGQWKARNRQAMQMMVRAFWREESVLLRHKLMSWTAERGAALVGPVLKQGKEEGLFDIGDPVGTAELIFQMGNGLSDAMAPLILSVDDHPENIDRLLEKVALYNRAIERILGLSEGAIRFVDARALRDILLA